MSGLIKIIFFVGDLIFLNLSIFLSFLWTGEFHTFNFGSNSIYLFVFSNLCWIFLVMVSTPYDVNKGWTLSRIVRSQFAFMIIHLLVVTSLIFFFNQDYSIAQIALIYGTFIPLFVGLRVVTLYTRKVFTKSPLVRNYILIGRNDLSKEVRKYFLMNPESGYKFYGYFDFDSSSIQIEELHDFCAHRDIHEIYCCLPNINSSDLRKLIDFGLDSLIKVKVITKVDFSQGSNLNLTQDNQMPAIDMSPISLDDYRNQIIKRIFDLIFSSIFMMAVMTWLIPMLFIIMKFDSKGPIFFLQLRSGKNNKPFKCFKFRTMLVNEESDSKQATKSDPRITKLGNFLRKTSLDELPQFINVFLGNMSVVGPRPHMLKHTEEYSKVIEKFMGRHYVKPGITGLAQCLGYRGETKNLTDMENRVRMDRYYIENWSFWFDMKIIFLTVISLIRGSDKAY